MTSSVADQIERQDHEIIEEIAEHLVSPSPLQRALTLLGKPVDAVLAKLHATSNPLMERIAGSIDEGIHRALSRSILLGGKIMRDETVVKRCRRRGLEVSRYEDVARLCLTDRDMIADTFSVKNGLVVATQGATFGAAASLAELSPGVQLTIPALIATDVASSLTLLARHLVQLGSVYGYSVRRDRGNIAHVLAAMVPQHLSSDESFLPLKLYVVNAAREVGEFAAKVGAEAGRVGFPTALQRLSAEAPGMVRLLNLVVEKLGVRLSQKVFAALVPVIGGAVNGSINLAFQQTGHRTGKDYFRLLVLSERYGHEVVRQTLDDEVRRRRSVFDAARPTLE